MRSLRFLSLSQLLLCGTGEYSVADLRAHHIANGSSPEFLRVLDWFWTAVSNFTQEEMARLLQFTTGCSQLPPGGFQQLSPRFQITAAPTFANLPTAHTWYASHLAVSLGIHVFSLIISLLLIFCCCFSALTNSAYLITSATITLNERCCWRSARALKVSAWSNRETPGVGFIKFLAWLDWLLIKSIYVFFFFDSETRLGWVKSHIFFDHRSYEFVS